MSLPSVLLRHTSVMVNRDEGSRSSIIPTGSIIVLCFVFIIHRIMIHIFIDFGFTEKSVKPISGLILHLGIKKNLTPGIRP